MKRIVFLLFFLSVSIFVCAEEISLENFTVNYRIVSGKELNLLFELGEKNKSDYFYVIGKVKSKMLRNAFVEISFSNLKLPSFRTSKFELGWIDGNDSAEKFFLLPIGMRDCALPENLSEMRCNINVKMIK